MNVNDFHHMGMSQMCTGAGDYFRTSKPHSEKLLTVISVTTKLHEEWDLQQMLQQVKFC